MHVFRDDETLFVGLGQESDTGCDQVRLGHSHRVADLAGQHERRRVGRADVDLALGPDRKRFAGANLETAQADVHDDDVNRLGSGRHVG